MTAKRSVAVANFETREALDEWLRTGPYIVAGVWQEVEVIPYKISPHYRVSHNA